MRRYLRTFGMSGVAFCLALTSTIAAAQPAKKPAGPLAGAKKQPDGAELVGKWIGEVNATIGDMSIGLTLRLGDGNAVAGELSTGHGEWSITNVKKTPAGWTIDFKTEDGDAGHLIAVLADGELKGDWDFRPKTTGKFLLKRVKAR